MRKLWMWIAAASFVVALAIHLAALAGATWEGNALFYGIIGWIIIVVTPCAFLTGDRAGTKAPKPAERRRWRLIQGAALGLILYVAALTWAVLSPEERSEMMGRGRVTIWSGESQITLSQARVLTAFPLPFFAFAALLLWDRMHRDRESFDI